MTREEYMIKLKKYLRKLPKQDYEDAIEYFNEYFSDTDKAGQQKLMEELGTPKQAAADLMYNLLDRKIQERNHFTRCTGDPVHTCDCPTFYCNACSPAGCCNLRSLRDHL